jgi:hypothetical protein
MTQEKKKSVKKMKKMEDLKKIIAILTAYLQRKGKHG